MTSAHDTAALTDAELRGEIAKRHDEGIERLCEWIRTPSVAAEDRGMEEGCEHVLELARRAGFEARRVESDGYPAIFGVLDVGAARTAGVYFMYDVHDTEDPEWSLPPFAASILERPGVGTILMGRGAANQKGPQAAFLAALHAIKGVGRRLPVNVVLVADGEQEIGSPHLAQVVATPEVRQALARCEGVFMPAATQDRLGQVMMALGAKGVLELQVTASGASWGRGPRRDVHSSNRARLDSPAFHLVQALATLVTSDGDLVDVLRADARPPTEAEHTLVRIAAERLSEPAARTMLSADRWVHDLSWGESLERLLCAPSVNLAGLASGYVGPAIKQVLPSRATATLEFRLVPAMQVTPTFEAVKTHFARQGFSDLELTLKAGYDPTTTRADTRFIQTQLDLYGQLGIDPVLLPRGAGSYPGYVFTTDPLHLPVGQFGLGTGFGAHGKDEYFVIEPCDPRVAGWDRIVESFTAYLEHLAA